MTLLQAMRRWPRDAIADFAFPQPRRPKSVILPRASDRSKLVRITKLGLPAQRDITALPDGVRRPRLQLRAAGRRVNPLFIYPPDNRSTLPSPLQSAMNAPPRVRAVAASAFAEWYPPQVVAVVLQKIEGPPERLAQTAAACCDL
jgi:hypothetical protein